MKTILFDLSSLAHNYQVDFFRSTKAACESLGFECVFLGLEKSGDCDIDLDIKVLPWNVPQASISGKLACHPEATDFLVGEIALRERQWTGASGELPKGGERKPDGCSFLLSAFDEILSLVRPSLVVLWNGEYANQLAFRKCCERIKVPVAFMERGLIPGSLFFDTAGISANSSFVSGTANDRLPSPKSFRFGDYTEEFLTKNSWWEQPERRDLGELGTRLGIRKGQKVVFFPSQVDGDTSNFMFSQNFAGNLDAFQWLCQQLRDRDDLFILGKHHPKSLQDPGLYADSTPANGAWIQDISIQDCLALSDYVALVNSTVAMEAMAFGKPTLALGDSLFANRNILYHVNDISSAADVIEKWLGKDDFPQRMENFKLFASELADHHLFAYQRELEKYGMRDAFDFGETLCRHASGTTPEWNEVNLSNALELICMATRIHEEYVPAKTSSARLEQLGGRKLVGLVARKILSRFPFVSSSP